MKRVAPDPYAFPAKRRHLQRVRPCGVFGSSNEIRSTLCRSVRDPVRCFQWSILAMLAPACAARAEPIPFTAGHRCLFLGRPHCRHNVVSTPRHASSPKARRRSQTGRPLGRLYGPNPLRSRVGRKRASLQARLPGVSRSLFAGERRQSAGARLCGFKRRVALGEAVSRSSRNSRVDRQ